jgi:carboxymethylenebutenolidase
MAKPPTSDLTPANSPAALPVAATTIHTSAAGLSTAWNTVPLANDLQLPVYVAKPTGSGPFPVVMVVQEIFGVHEHIADVARRLAGLGYLALAPDLYFRLGNAAAVSEIDLLRRDFVAKTSDAQVLGDLDATVSWSASQGGDVQRLGLTGFCWGGRIAWLYAAHQPRVRAVVAWYGRLLGERTTIHPQHPVDVVDRLSAPVLGLYGGQDQGIPLSSVNALRAGLEAVGHLDSEIILYPEAGHAFFADYRSSYRRTEAQDGWRRLQAWFVQHGVS